MPTAEEHAEEMRAAEARMDALTPVLAEAIAAGRDTSAIDAALDECRRDYRRAEGKHRRACKREGQ